MINFNKILLAHYKTQKTVIIHGSSGFGKTTTVRKYVEFANAKLIDKRTSTLDPLTLFLPYLSKDKSVINNAVAEWIDVMYNAKQHTVIFLDELTNPSMREVYSVMKEMLCERTFLGKKFSDHIQFIAATNLESEDIDVKPLPDSLWKRATHLNFIPQVHEIINHLDPLVQPFYAQNQEHLKKPSIAKFPLEGVGRQINDVVELYKTGLLTGTDLIAVCEGRVGENGAALAEFLLNSDKKYDFPQVLDETTYEALSRHEADGRSIEVVNFLRRESHVKENVAQYLAQYAYPETCRAFSEAGFICCVKEGFDDKAAGMPWQVYAKARKCISFQKQG